MCDRYKSSRGNSEPLTSVGPILERCLQLTAKCCMSTYKEQIFGFKNKGLANIAYRMLQLWLILISGIDLEIELDVNKPSDSDSYPR